MCLITAVGNQVFALAAVTCHYRGVPVFKDRTNERISSPLNHEAVLNRVLNMDIRVTFKTQFLI